MNHNNQQPGSANLPPLPEPFDHVDMADGSIQGVFSVERYRQGQRDAIAASRRAATPASTGQAAPVSVVRSALEFAHRALKESQPRDIQPAAWDRHNLAIDMVFCALHLPNAAQPAEGSALVARTEQVETEMADRLRRIVVNRGEGPITVQSKLLLQAADECDRFYNGMMNWKANAQDKDRIIIEQRAAPERSDTPARLDDDFRTVIVEAAQVLESAAAHNRQKNRTVLAHSQQERADRLRIGLARIDGDKQGAQGGDK